MKKIIEIPDSILIDLKIMAVEARKDLKNYIKNILESTVANERKRKHKISVK